MIIITLGCWIGAWELTLAIPTADQDPDILRCIDVLLHEKFNQSLLLIDSLIKKYPNDPAPLFIKGMIYWRQSYNMQKNKQFDQFCQKYWTQSISLSEKLIKSNTRDGYAYFFKGGACGYLGNLFIRQNSYVKAGLNAIKGINNLEDSFELDSIYWDYYYGNGLYHVAAANSSSIVRFLQKLLPMPSGDENLGVSHLRLASDKGNFTPLLAKAILAFTYTYYRVNYDSAFYYAEPLIEKYPENTDFMVLLLNLYFHQGLKTGTTDWQSALATLNQLDSQMIKRSEHLENWYQEKYSFFKGYTQFKLGQYLESEDQLREFISRQKKNPYEGVAWLTLGVIEDLRNNRAKAIQAYKKAQNCKEIGNLTKLARQFQSKAYQAGNGQEFFRGLEYKLPENP